MFVLAAGGGDGGGGGAWWWLWWWCKHKLIILESHLIEQSNSQRVSLTLNNCPIIQSKLHSVVNARIARIQAS